MKRIELYPRVQIDKSGTAVVSQAGGLALVETIPADANCVVSRRTDAQLVDVSGR